MIHAYDKSYLLDARLALASMFDFGVNVLKLDINELYNLFLVNKVSEYFENGDSSIISGKSGIELALMVTYLDRPKDYTVNYERSKEYWLGYYLAYYQWYTNYSFNFVNEVIPIKDLLDMYDKYHEMDENQFVDQVNLMLKQRKKMTNLKYIREKNGYTQEMVSRFSNVPLRTIQQYEQGQKNINNAKAESVLAISQVLRCKVNDLLE